MFYKLFARGIICNRYECNWPLISVVIQFVAILHNMQFGCCFNLKNHVLEKQTNGANLTNTWSVKLNVQYDKSVNELHARANEIANSIGMVSLGQVGELTGHYVFTSKDNEKVDALFLQHSDIEWHAQQELLKREKRFPVQSRKKRSANSFFSSPRDPLYPQQWHLHNKLRKIDCNVTGVWENNISGRGVVVAVVDDGVQWRHPDLKDNYCSEGSFDLNSDDDDPTPEPDDKDENKHGTRCAGEIAAVANDVCGVGIAYNARFSGIRILDGPMTDSIEATAFNKHMDVNDVYSCSWGPEDDGKTVDGPRSLAQAALKHGVVAGRNGFGSIFIVASGNGGSQGDNCNYDGYANSIYTITIAAVDEFGNIPSYSEQCTSMLASTVSSGGQSARSIVTTDWTLGHNSNQCTDDHTGTSAATPLVAGMVALMLEARPCLCWRDVQHIMAMTAIPLYTINPSLSKKTWSKNAAGFFHSNNHGFGLLDSWSLVNAAKIWRQVPWLTSFKPSCPDTNKLIPNNGSSLVVNTTVSEDECNKHLLKTLEQILVTVSVNHPSRGNLRFVFICPSGTRSVIPPRRKDTSDLGLTEWTFTTVRCWGEKPFGKYQLQVTDTKKKRSLESGTLLKWKVTLYGSQMTFVEINSRRDLINNALSGEFISPGSNFSLPCPLGQPLSFDVTKALSERTLKLVAMLSCFFVFWGAYYTIEMACCNDEDKEKKEEPGDGTEASTSNTVVNYNTYTGPSLEPHVGESSLLEGDDIPMLDLQRANEQPDIEAGRSTNS